MIISASRRTDIPAFYAEWMVRRLNEGYCTVANPYNRNQVTRISLTPEDVDAIVFWTRNPRPPGAVSRRTGLPGVSGTTSSSRFSDIRGRSIPNHLLPRLPAGHSMSWRNDWDRDV